MAVADKPPRGSFPAKSEESLDPIGYDIKTSRGAWTKKALIQRIEELEDVVALLRSETRFYMARYLIVEEYLRNYGPLPHRKDCPDTGRFCSCGASYLEKIAAIMKPRKRSKKK